jgi:hypothetical protein
VALPAQADGVREQRRQLALHTRVQRNTAGSAAVQVHRRSRKLSE